MSKHLFPRMTRLRDFWRNRDGAAAVEFALYGPLLIMACIATFDSGRALYEKIAISEIVRTGAHTAMADRGTSTVEKVMRVSAQPQFTVAPATTNTSDTTIVAASDALSVSAVRYCACPDNWTVEVACSTTCTGAPMTSIYYRVSAEKAYQGIVLPNMTIASRTAVQVR